MVLWITLPMQANSRRKKGDHFDMEPIREFVREAQSGGELASARRYGDTDCNERGAE